MISTLLAAAVAVLGAVHLVRMTGRKRREAETARVRADSSVGQVLEDVRDVSSGTVGVRTWAGTWNGRQVQVRTIVDTLAIRKLPTLWLSVTVTEPVATPGVLDVMLRPAGPTTFSRFDDLPDTLPTPPGWPELAVVRSDTPATRQVLDAIVDKAGFLTDPRVKELLITPNGVRIVAAGCRGRPGALRGVSPGGFRNAAGSRSRAHPADADGCRDDLADGQRAERERGMSEHEGVPTPAPRRVLAASALLPGSGHVMLRLPYRGMQFLFFMVVLGWVSKRVMPADASFFARHVGGILIYGVSVLDAYRIARIRAEVAAARRRADAEKG